MKNLEKMTDRAIEIVKECCGENSLTEICRPITINTRATSRWGCCRKSGNISRIEISSRILRDEVPEDATMSIIVHEVLHACKGTKGHTGLWKSYAWQVNRKYPELEIARTASAEKFGLEEEQKEIKRQYAIRCTHCGQMHYSSKLSKSIKFPERYRCGRCGGNLERVF